MADTMDVNLVIDNGQVYVDSASPDNRVVRFTDLFPDVIFTVDGRSWECNAAKIRQAFLRLQTVGVSTQVIEGMVERHRTQGLLGAYTFVKVSCGSGHYMLKWRHGDEGCFNRPSSHRFLKGRIPAIAALRVECKSSPWSLGDIRSWTKTLRQKGIEVEIEEN